MLNIFTKGKCSKKKEKVLNIIDPPIGTYQGISFVLAVLLCDNKTENLYYNNYINLTVDNENDYTNMGLRFTNVSWENYRIDGFANMDMYYVKNIKHACFIEFLKKLIDLNNYLLLFGVDEFYLSYSEFYKKIHFIHDTYIYGYDENSFYLMAYTNENLKKIRICCHEIRDAIYGYLQKNNNASFCTFRPVRNKYVTVDTGKICRELNDYINKRGSDIYAKTDIYGIATYTLLQKYIGYVSVNSEVKIDLRIFRTFWEHKKVMCERIQYLSKVYSISLDVCENIKSIEKQSRLIFLLATKYYLSGRKEILERILLLMRKVQDGEMELIVELLNELNRQ